MVLPNNMLEEYWRLREEIRNHLFRRLNPEQYKAVETGEGPVLCLAGAGSGKTTAMVYRVLHLLLFGPKHNPKPEPPADMTEQDLRMMEDWLKQEKNRKAGLLPLRIKQLIGTLGISARSILAITFTNKAAEEMRTRLEGVLGATSREMWVMTFHAACVRILRREITALGYTSDFVIYDTQDQQQVIKGVLKELNLDEKKFAPRTMSHLISKFKNELKNTQDAKLLAGDFLEDKAAQVYEIYQKRLKENNALDFDDLIMLTVQVFEKHPEVLKKYQERFRYIMVDEYQDTNHAQYVLVNLLARKYKNLCVVGDDDQSIYGFRQADIRNILEFERDYPQAKVIKLEQNYRSTQSILAAANQVIKNNVGRKKKSLWTENPQGERLVLYRAQNEQDEARYVAERIREFTQGHYRYQDCAVLMRTNAQSRVLEEWFLRAGIPYKIVGGLKFYERKEIKDILAYLKLLANPSDSISLRRIINVPRRGVGEATVQKVEDFSRAEGLPVYEALKQYENLSLTAKIAKGIAGFVNFMDKMYRLVGQVSLTELTEKIMVESGYWQELLEDNTVESQSRRENLKEFLTVTQNYEKEAVEPSLGGFLAEVSLVSDIDTLEDQNQAVVVMTMHTAKGLEFPVVFIVGMEEGIFPHSRSLLNESELEEERRLCYVALTRAKEKIHLVCARERNLYGNTSYNPPSRFIGEIPPQLWEEYQSNHDFFRTTRAPAPPLFTRQGGLIQFNVGDKVEHRKWGQGVVVSVKGEGEEAEIKVAFPNLGIKSLVAKYAPISKIQ